MNTKNIFKTVALAMLMPAMLLTTACSNEDDNLINNDNNNQKGYALPVTVNVTRQGDATTRATFDGSKLSFSTGDKLLVRGNDESVGGGGRFAGMLDYDTEKGNFSGTIYTQNSYSGTADALFTAANSNWVGAALFPNGYDTYEFLSLSGSGYSTSYSMSYDKAIAATKADAVAQFSLETAKTYSSGFALSPENAIFNFTITGLTDGEKAVTLKDGTRTMFTGNVTPSSGTAAFALGAMIKNYSDFPVNLNNLTLTIGGTEIDITDANNNLAAGKIYNITRSALITSPAVGQVIGDDGKNYADATAASLAGATAVAVIAYVGSDTKDAIFKNGLAIALADEGSGEMGWSTAKSICESKTPTVTGAKWCLPSNDQWTQMFTANGGSYTGLNTTITNAGGTTLQEGENTCYWSSTEDSPSRAYFVELNGGNVDWWFGSKDSSVRARACLAF